MVIVHALFPLPNGQKQGTNNGSEESVHAERGCMELPTPVLAVPQGEPANRGSTCPKHQKQTVLLRHAAYCGCHSLNDGWQNGTGNGPVFGKSHSVQLHWDLWGTI